MELEKNGREHDQFNQGIIIYYLRYIIYNQFNHLRFNHLLIYHL